MTRTNVFLIREGGFGGAFAKEGAYDTWISLVKRLLEESATVKIVSSWGEAVTEVIDDGPGMKKSAVVFFTKGMLSRAEALKKEYPNLQVALLTSDSSEVSADHSGVLVINKTDFDRDAVKKAVLA